MSKPESFPHCGKKFSTVWKTFQRSREFHECHSQIRADRLAGDSAPAAGGGSGGDAPPRAECPAAADGGRFDPVHAGKRVGVPPDPDGVSRRCAAAGGPGHSISPGRGYARGGHPGGGGHGGARGPGMAGHAGVGGKSPVASSGVVLPGHSGNVFLGEVDGRGSPRRLLGGGLLLGGH